MTEARLAVACVECRVHWYLDHESAKCTDTAHEHRRFEVHRHRSVVVLPDGTEVTAVSFDAAEPYDRDSSPDYGLYLDHRWQPPWTHDHLDWPDFGVPEDTAEVMAALRSVLARARAGERLEVGCLGGRDRTLYRSGPLTGAMRCQLAWPLNCNDAPRPVRNIVTPLPVKVPPVSVMTPSLTT